MTREEAEALAGADWWEHVTPQEAALFQMQEDRLCMSFSKFHELMEQALGRPVYTHEFGLNRDGLLAELKGDAEAPTLEEIINLIPKEKRLIVLAPGQED